MCVGAVVAIGPGVAGLLLLDRLARRLDDLVVLSLGGDVVDRVVAQRQFVAIGLVGIELVAA